MGGGSLCAAGLLGVDVMWCLWSFLLEVGSLGGGGGYLGDGRCDGRSLGGVPDLWYKPAGDVLLYQSSYGWVFPWEFLPWVGMSCVRCVCSFGGRVVCGLWWPGFCGRPLVGFRGCVASVVPIWCG